MIHMKTNPLYKKMQEKSKLDKCKEAEQELNRMIDFYRDATSKSDYKSADHSIKQAEKALDYLFHRYRKRHNQQQKKLL